MNGGTSVDLSGLRILAVTQYGAGPYATQHLADLGADVIKIEPPGHGDYGRALPPYTNEDHTDSLFFQALNRGVRSVCLDLASDEGQEVLHALVAESDAVFANLRADVGKQLGLDYHVLRKANPQITCCWLTGYGRRGPRAGSPGFDYMVQAESGIMSLSGDPDRLPAKAGVSIIDFATGIAASFAITAGILTAQRRGYGGDVDVTLRDTAASLLNYVATWHLSAGFVPERLASSAHPSLVPSQLFACSDAPIIIMVNKEKFWPRLAAAVGHPEWATREDRNTFAARLANRTDVQRDLAAIFCTDTAANWLQRLAEFGVPSGPVRTVPEAFTDPDYYERTVAFEHTDFGLVRTPGVLVSSDEERKISRAPAIGEHTNEVLQTVAGLSLEQIAALRRQNVV